MANDLLGPIPRSLAYVAAGSWRTAVLAVAVPLLVGGVAWVRAGETPPVAAARSLSPRRIGSRFVAGPLWRARRALLATGLAVGCIAWVVVAAFVVHGRVTEAITAPIPGLVTRLLAVPLVLGAVGIGPVLDRAGPRTAGVLGFLGAGLGSAVLVATSGVAPLGIGIVLLGPARGRW